jgi:hypothetical protein
VLDPSGKGDNYGVALGFPQKQGIYVTYNTYSHNYQAKENRLDKRTSYFRRVLALHYFLSTKPNFNRVNRFWFTWSLIGNSLLALSKGRFYLVHVNLKAIALILTHRNPYVVGKIKGEKIIKPV